jgi:membrane protein implicated in regulation of membrane protease activity
MADRLHRFYRWLTSPDSPTQYPYRDIAAHRATARILSWLGYLAVAVGLGNDLMRGEVDAETAYFVVAVLAVTLFVARGLRMQALRWQIEELEERTRESETE